MQAAGIRLQDLGNLDGDVLVFGGPYSNFQASAALLDLAESRKIEPANRICTGDIVAYCGDPAATLDLWRGQCVLVAGNCEKQLGAGAPDCGCGFAVGSACDRLSKDWYPFADAALSHSQRMYLAAAPDLISFSHLGRRYAAVHGGITDVARYLWSVTPDREFSHEISNVKNLIGQVDCVIAGHSGIAFQTNVEGIEWFNAGAIGMPGNDGNPATQFGMLTENGPTIEYLSYDHAGASAAMKRAGLTQGYETALTSGYWPTEEILPLSLRRGSLRASG